MGKEIQDVMDIEDSSRLAIGVDEYAGVDVLKSTFNVAIEQVVIYDSFTSDTTIYDKVR